jgi:hypothetical protein
MLHSSCFFLPLVSVSFGFFTFYFGYLASCLLGDVYFSIDVFLGQCFLILSVLFCSFHFFSGGRSQLLDGSEQIG